MFHVSVCSLKTDLRHSTAEFSSGRWLLRRYSLSLRKSGSFWMLIKSQEDALRLYLPYFEDPSSSAFDSGWPSFAGREGLFGKRSCEKFKSNVRHILKVMPAMTKLESHHRSYSDRLIVLVSSLKKGGGRRSVFPLETTKRTYTQSKKRTYTHILT